MLKLDSLDIFELSESAASDELELCSSSGAKVAVNPNYRFSQKTVELYIDKVMHNSFASLIPSLRIIPLNLEVYANNPEKKSEYLSPATARNIDFAKIIKNILRKVNQNQSYVITSKVIAPIVLQTSNTQAAYLVYLSLRRDRHTKKSFIESIDLISVGNFSAGYKLNEFTTSITAQLKDITAVNNIKIHNLFKTCRNSDKNLILIVLCYRLLGLAGYKGIARYKFNLSLGKSEMDFLAKGGPTLKNDILNVRANIINKIECEASAGRVINYHLRNDSLDKNIIFDSPFILKSKASSNERENINELDYSDAIYSYGSSALVTLKTFSSLFFIIAAGIMYYNYDFELSAIASVLGGILALRFAYALYKFIDYVAKIDEDLQETTPQNIASEKVTNTQQDFQQGSIVNKKRVTQRIDVKEKNPTKVGTKNDIISTKTTVSSRDMFDKMAITSASKQSKMDSVILSKSKEDKSTNKKQNRFS